MRGFRNSRRAILHTLTLITLLACSISVFGQISPTHVFSPNTVISSSQINSNFALLANALNRTGGTITGNIAVSGGITIDGVDLSAWLDQSVKIAATPTHAGLVISGAGATAINVATGGVTAAGATITGTGASALDVGGGLNIGTGNVALVDTTGKIPALTGTYFTSVDGTTLTGLAKLASTNTFTGRNDLKGYTETKSTSNPSAAAITYDLSTGTHFETALTGNATVTISNVPNPSNGVVAFTVKFTADGTLRTFTWPGSVVWSGGTAITFTSTNNKRDFVTFISYDAGTTWFSFIGGQNF